ncbi:hypothetical protein [Tychonema bourrellyi]|nr:hypothetical protein [Tychonema bourrellyi]
MPVPQDNLSFVEQASCLLPQILANFRNSPERGMEIPETNLVDAP